MSKSTLETEIALDTTTHGPAIALITINREHKLNALTQDHYFRIASLLVEIAKMEKVLVTVLTGKGRFFSAGADVSISRSTPESQANPREFWLKSFVANNLHTTHAFATHPKLLVVALNGPAVGLSAALTANADFIYCTPSTFLLTPFSSLGLVTEGGAALAMVRRLGISKANEALLMSRKVPSDVLERTGYVNKVFSVEGGSDAFLAKVIEEVQEMLTGGHLNGEALLGIKRMIRESEGEKIETVGAREVMAGLDRFLSGAPQREFEAVRTGKKKHKL